MTSADIIIIGGGLSGSTTALGLVQEGAGKVMVFDKHLPSQRLSRGNFGLTWFMTKGDDHPAYAQWCRMATQQWPDFARALEEETGYDVELEWTGGAVHAFGDKEFQTHAEEIEKIRKTCSKAGLDYPVKMLNRSEFADLVPDMQLGDDVSGAMYTSEQGHVNPLKLLTALRSAFQKKGGIFHGGLSVNRILPQKDGTIILDTGRDRYRCRKLVIAAGHGSVRLLHSLGETLNIYPLRGQVMVSERVRRMLHVPELCVRQTCDGTFLIGYSEDDVSHDISVTPDAMKRQAANAIRLFPELARLNWIRAWAAVRVLTPDGAPIYSRVRGHDNIYVLALHSAVSLAPLKISA
ncbi:MAG: FAD-binding oxidoreductase, partial [Desulfobacteraceae bacterium]|nr:FAD-binding oxidoreductase [Desulfobacteraceae bacterium]